MHVLPIAHLVQTKRLTYNKRAGKPCRAYLSSLTLQPTSVALRLLASATTLLICAVPSALLACDFRAMLGLSTLRCLFSVFPRHVIIWPLEDLHSFYGNRRARAFSLSPSKPRIISLVRVHPMLSSSWVGSANCLWRESLARLAEILASWSYRTF